MRLMYPIIMIINFIIRNKESFNMQNEERQITFNDIPEVLSEILKRFDLLDQSMELIREEVRRTKRPSLSDHIPIKKSTMYTYIQNGEIPVNQKGKKYTFFRDDLIKWLESGCKIEAPISTMEINQILSKRPKRRTL